MCKLRLLIGGYALYVTNDMFLLRTQGVPSWLARRLSLGLPPTGIIIANSTTNKTRCAQAHNGPGDEFAGEKMAIRKAGKTLSEKAEEVLTTLTDNAAGHPFEDADEGLSLQERSGVTEPQRKVIEGEALEAQRTINEAHNEGIDRAHLAYRHASPEGREEIDRGQGWDTKVKTADGREAIADEESPSPP